MSARLLATLAFGLFSLMATGQTLEEQVDTNIKLAVAMYPEVNDENHPLCKAVAARIDYYETHGAHVFNAPEWPLHFAREEARKLGILPVEERPLPKPQVSQHQPYISEVTPTQQPQAYEPPRFLREQDRRNMLGALRGARVITTIQQGYSLSDEEIQTHYDRISRERQLRKMEGDLDHVENQMRLLQQERAQEQMAREHAETVRRQQEQMAREHAETVRRQQELMNNSGY